MTPTPSTAQNDQDQEIFMQIYDMLMAEIEPELMTISLPHLSEVYADETALEAVARQERYARAFDEMIRRARMLRDIHDRDVGEFITYLKNTFKAEGKKTDENGLSAAESNLDAHNA